MHQQTRNRNGGRGARVGTLRGLDVTAVNLLLVAAVAVGFVTYLALNNGVSTKGFKIREIKARISKLQEERQRIDLAAVAGQSMDVIDGRIKGLGFVPVSSLDFVSANGGEVAMR